MRIVAAIALMAPLPGGMNGAQHAVIGLAHLGGDFANAVWKPFSEEALGAGKPIAPRPREAVWRAAISRTLILETCRFAANDSAARAGDAPYIELREERVDRKTPGTTRVRRIEATILHYDGAGRGMPGDLCGAIRFAGLGAEGALGIAAAGHRNALAVLLPYLRAIAVDLAAHYVTGSPVYGRPLPDLDPLLESRGLAGRYAGVLDAALEQPASEEQAELARVVAEDARAASWDVGRELLQHHRPPHRPVPGRRPQYPRRQPAAAEPGAMDARRRCRRQGELTTALIQSRRLPAHAVLRRRRGRGRIARAGAEAVAWRRDCWSSSTSTA